MPTQIAQEPLKVFKVMTADGLCEIADLRPGDLLQVTVNRAGTYYTTFCIFHSYSPQSCSGETLGLLRRDRHCDWLSLGLLRRDRHCDWLSLDCIKVIRLFARDAELAFNWLSSLQEDNKHLRSKLETIKNLTLEFGNKIQKQC